MLHVLGDVWFKSEGGRERDNIKHTSARCERFHTALSVRVEGKPLLLLLLLLLHGALSGQQQPHIPLAQRRVLPNRTTTNTKESSINQDFILQNTTVAQYGMLHIS